MLRRMIVVGTGLMLALVLASSPALAQITTGTVSGTVKDAQGGVIPGATVVLISETRGTKSAPAVTNETGNYVFPNVTPDTYTVEVTLEAFKTVKRAGIAVSGGDRVGVPADHDRAGRARRNRHGHRRIAARADAERRAVVRGHDDADREPAGRAQQLHQPDGVHAGRRADGASAGGTRLGGAGQNNIMMDGISAMDTGNNGQMLNMNVDSIGEVKILTQGYQAEYGRSSGLQITAVTKSGTEPVPRVGLRHPDQLGLGREQLGQREERRSEGEDRAPRRWATRSAARSASRAATTSCSSSTRTNIVR